MESNPQRIIADGLLAPVNGMYGIEGEDGSVSVYNSGSLYGAIDVALFVLVIGGLALGRVRYDRWLRFTWPLLLVLFLIYAVVLSIGTFFPNSMAF